MYENRAAEDFIGHKEIIAKEEKRRFVNMREALIDVLCTLEREADVQFTRRLKKRVIDSRSESELRMVMDGLLVISGFHSRPQP